MHFECRRERGRLTYLFSSACIFQSFLFRNPLGATSWNLCDTPPHSPAIHTMQFLTYRTIQHRVRLYCGPLVRASALFVTRADSHTHAGNFETLTQWGKLPFPSVYGRRGTQSLDYSTADFSRRFQPASAVLPRRHCSPSVPANATSRV